MKGYGVVDFETGEKRFIFLTEEEWDKAYTHDEVVRMKDHLERTSGD